MIIFGNEQYSVSIILVLASLKHQIKWIPVVSFFDRYINSAARGLGVFETTLFGEPL